jgi:hypothetical protein
LDASLRLRRTDQVVGRVLDRGGENTRVGRARSGCGDHASGDEADGQLAADQSGKRKH